MKFTAIRLDAANASNSKINFDVVCFLLKGFSYISVSNQLQLETASSSYERALAVT